MEKGKRKHLDRMCRINRIKKTFLPQSFAEKRRARQTALNLECGGKTPLFLRFY
jgi:hypothetical protein